VFIALKPVSFIQEGVGRITKRFLISNLFVVVLPAEVWLKYPTRLVLAFTTTTFCHWGLVFVTVVQGLFFWLCGGAAGGGPSLNDPSVPRFPAVRASKLAGLAFRYHLQSLRVAAEGEQVMHQ